MFVGRSSAGAARPAVRSPAYGVDARRREQLLPASGVSRLSPQQFPARASSLLSARIARDPTTCSGPSQSTRPSPARLSENRHQLWPAHLGGIAAAARQV